MTINERADLSTNAGAGTDIAGAVADRSWLLQYITLAGPLFTASQTQTAGAELELVLRPYFTPYDGGPLTGLVVLEAAFGADPDSDQSTWTWTDLAALGLVHQPAGIRITAGKPTATSTADPVTISFSLLNLNGEFSAPTGTYNADFVRNLPFRVRLTGIGVGATDGYHRGTAFLASARLRWASDGSTTFSVVDVVCRGRLARVQKDAETKPVHSAGYRALVGMSYQDTTPIAYWSFEDDSGASRPASAIAGVAPTAIAVAGVTFAASSTLYDGSDPLATFSATSAVSANVPAHAPCTTFNVIFAMSIPSEPAAQTILAYIRATGSVATWRISLTPGASALVVDAYNSAGTSLGSANVAVTEADFYGQPVVYVFSVGTNGTGTDFSLFAYYGTSSSWALSGNIATSTHGNVTLIQTVYDAGLNGATFGHLAVYADTTYADPRVLITANTGEWPWQRFYRLCQEEGIPAGYTISENFDLTMGPQPSATIPGLLAECEAVEAVSLHDHGVVIDESLTTVVGDTGVLWFPSRTERQNATVALTLDMSAGQVAPGFEPALDDQGAVNDVEVTRDSGSSARAVDEDSIAAEARTRQQIPVNTEDDTFLQDLATWRLNIGTNGGRVGEMRFPSVGWNLRRSPELAQEWLACTVGSKVAITNPPSQYPPDDIEAFIEGYTETLGSHTWEVRANLSPALPYGVFELAETASDAGEWVGRLAGDDDAAIRVAINTSALSIDFDPNRYRWTTVADDFDPDLSVRFGKETADVSAIATTAATFVAAGALSSADNAAVTPALYAGATTRDLVLVLARIRAASAGTLTKPTGYTRLPIKNFSSTEKIQLYAKVHSGSESNPTVTPSGGAAGDTVSAVTFGLRNMPCTLTDLADIVVDSWGQSNASAQNIAYPGLFPRYQEGCVVLAIGGKDDDWTSVATLSGFAEAVDSSTTTGNDQGLVIDYVIQTTPAVINEGSFTVTGGANAVSHGALIALAGGYQIMTISARSTNGVTKSHAAGTKIEVDKPYVLGL